MWRDTQSAFAAAAIDPDVAPPPEIRDPAGRFDVYRNNVAVSLNEALAEVYPVVKTLVGDEFFTAMAQVYLRTNLPSSPVLLDYGDGFADFIASFGPAQGVPSLADVAVIERAWLDSYHAADASPLAIGILASIDDAALEDVQLHLHPSLRLIATPRAAVSIWQEHQGDDAPNLSNIIDAPEYAVIVRPGLDVLVHVIDASLHMFLSAVQDGAPLGAALSALDHMDDVDPSALLSFLFQSGCVVGLDVAS